MKDELTPSELAFLSSQNLGPDDVFDARWMSQARWFREIKKAGKTIALGSPCRKAGHRLRSRKGHCAQCDTKVLAYASRYDLEQYIYIAGSLRARLIKIGVCKDLLQRVRQISSERHGDSADWEIIYAVHMARSGEIEERVLHRL
ncbi:GIY-YIG nuclease family protein, partial [Bradyrhizobium sp. SUTN9-2]|uniref:GIY-YIG nuclease family protein n=1 Tax=Bradyrhizobium sp. SUTN9-2 TaxID=1167456 RepID=UPI000D65A974